MGDIRTTNTQQTLLTDGWVTTETEDEEIFLEILVLHQPLFSHPVHAPAPAQLSEKLPCNSDGAGLPAWSGIANDIQISSLLLSIYYTGRKSGM